MFSEERDTFQLVGSIVSGILSNPELTKEEIYWDNIIDDAIAAAERIKEKVRKGFK